MNYQELLLALGEDIFCCPNYCRDGACRGELADVSNGVYTHGPEICFVGRNYGQFGIPRILFTRLNPTWNQDIGWFGTLESVQKYREQHPRANAKDVFNSYLKGWSQGGKVYRGIWDAGTVTGHPNRSTLPGFKKRLSPRYGIQVFMEEMIRAGVFPMTDESPLEYCAINNVVKCAGSLPKSNPSTSMYRRCNYYEKELDILEPHIIVAFGDDTHKYLSNKLKHRFLRVGNQVTLKMPNGVSSLYQKFLHPLGQGKSTWRGEDVRHLRPDHCINRDIGPKEQEQFKAGHDGNSTSNLFNYTLYLVSEAKRLKDTLNTQ